MTTPLSPAPIPCFFQINAMILRRLKLKSVVASVIFTCSLTLIYSLVSKLQLCTSTAEAISATKDIELKTNTIPKANNIALTENESVASIKIQKFVNISQPFRAAILQKSSYWNRKQYSLVQQMDSVGRLERNTLEEEKPIQRPCNLTSLEVLHFNLHDFSNYSPMFQDFVRGMHCRDPPILIDQPNKCPRTEGKGHPFLLFAIKSAPRNFEQRQAVRETWGLEGTYNGGLKVRTVFLLGTFSMKDPNMEEMVRFEALRYRDILQWNFTDTFFNLTLKDNAFLTWVLLRCPGTSFIFKGDDDVFVNQPAMINYLRSLTPGNASSLYSGHIVSHASPIRKRISKYYVPHSFYGGPYPSYAGGGGFLFSGALVSPLYQVSRHIILFPIDDVYTGMCFQALGITPVRHPGFQTFDIRKEDRRNVCAHKKLLLVHRRTPQQLLYLWRHIINPMLQC